ncbi:MAG: TonB-dependent receptor [Bacteroidales bacterium]|nr:TonB-dependent receptor [Bacteroidales bacterium]
MILKYHFPSQGDAVYLAGIQGAFKENENGEAPNRVLPDHTSNDIALYTLIQYPFSEKLHFQAGVRGDARTIDIPEQEASGHSHDEEAHEEEEEEHLEAFGEAYQNFSGSAGLTYRLNPKLLFRANLSSGYRTPNTAELSQEGIHGIRYERGNRALNSQRNYEADSERSLPLLPFDV